MERQKHISCSSYSPSTFLFLGPRLSFYKTQKVFQRKTNMTLSTLGILLKLINSQVYDREMKDFLR
jgi:hypothetical protein